MAKIFKLESDFAFFSAEHALRGAPVYVWLTKEGKEVEVTHISFESAAEHYPFKDKVMVGEVVSYVRMKRD